MKKFKTKKKLQKEIKKYLIQKEKLKKNSWKGEWSANGEIDKKVSETFGKHKLELTLKILQALAPFICSYTDFFDF